MRTPSSFLLLGLLAATTCLGAEAPAVPGPGGAGPEVPPPAASPVEEIRRDAKALSPLFQSTLVKQFLAATAGLPSIAPRVAYRDGTTRRYASEAEAARLPEELRKGLKRLDLDEAYYYNTRYGTPLAYARPLEVAAAGLTSLAGSRILDFGYGSIGHLRLMASMGADVVGVEVDPLLKLLYSAAGDQGVIKGREGVDGRLTLVDGQFPAGSGVREAVGGGFDFIISKNVLKHGYIHPSEPVDPNRLVHLGVDDETFVRALFDTLKPGGRVLVYNLCPAPAPPGEPYIPWADGRSPFTEALWRKVGFQVVAFDRDDSAAARAMAHALGWDKSESPMDLEKDLFATYTLARRP